MSNTKTISMSFNEYNRELKEAKEFGRQEMKDSISALDVILSLKNLNKLYENCPKGSIGEANSKEIKIAIEAVKNSRKY
jgi:hypothetical protein